MTLEAKKVAMLLYKLLEKDNSLSFLIFLFFQFSRNQSSQQKFRGYYVYDLKWCCYIRQKCLLRINTPIFLYMSEERDIDEIVEDDFEEDLDEDISDDFDEE